MRAFCKSTRLCLVGLFAALAAQAADSSAISQRELVGRYAIAVTSGEVRLSLATQGRFLMRSPSDMPGGDNETRGSWRIDQARLRLTIDATDLPPSNVRVRGWTLYPMRHQGAVILVPAETLELYRQGSRSAGTFYRRISQTK